MRLSEIAARLSLEFIAEGYDDIAVEGVAAHESAGPAHLVFAESEVAVRMATNSNAGAVLTTRALVALVAGKPLLLARQPKLAFAQVARLLRRQPECTGIDPSAIVSPDAAVAPGVSIGAGTVVGPGASIESGCILDAGVVVGEGVRLGSGCHLYPRVVLYPGTQLGDRVIVHAGAVLGADGFGYVRDRTTGEYTQFPQQGRLLIADDVEIGANTTIDRGALEATRIGRGTKLDNLVHVGHNVQIGCDVVIAAQTGISGSSIVGDGAVIGGQVGLGDHAEVGPGVILGGQAGVLPGKRLEGPGEVLWGTPAKPVKQYLRELASLTRLTRRVRAPR